MNHMKACLVLVFVVLLVPLVYAESIEFRDHNNITITRAYPWQNVTVRVSGFTTINNYYANISTPTANITVSLAKADTNVYEGHFYPNEMSTVAQYSWILLLTGQQLTATSDVNGDGTSVTAYLNMSNEPDNIITYKDHLYQNISDEFNVGDIVYARVATTQNLTPHNIVVTYGGVSIQVNVSQNATYRGLYEGNFNITNETENATRRIAVSGGANFTITADVGNNDTTDASVSKNARDYILTYQDSSYTIEKEYFGDAKVVWISVNNSAHNTDSNTIELGYSIVNSSLDRGGINVTLRETGANTGIFRGNFTVDSGGTSDITDHLDASDGGKIWIYADLDANNKLQAVKTLIADLKSPDTVTVHNITNGTYLRYNHLVNITVADSVMTNKTITLYYWRAHQAEDLDRDGSIDVGDGQAVLVNGTENLSTWYEAYIPTKAIPDNTTVSLWLVGTDKGGNNISFTLGGNYSVPLKTFFVDNTGPRVDVSEPSNLGNYASDFNITFNVTDNASGVDYNNISYAVRNITHVFINETFIKSNQCYLDVNGSNKTYCNVTGISLASVPFAFDIVVQINVYDKASNKAAQLVRIYHVNDTIAAKIFTLSITDYNKTIEVERAKNETISFVVKNNGTTRLTNITYVVSGISLYKLKETSDTLDAGASKTIYLLIDVPSNYSAGNYSSVLNISSSNTSSAAAFTVTINYNNNDKMDMNNTYADYMKKVEAIKSDITLIISRNIDVSSLQSSAVLLEKELNKTISYLKAGDYFAAKPSLDKAKNILEPLQQKIAEIKGTLPWGPEIYLVPLIIIVIILVYLFWPVKEHPQWRIKTYGNARY